MLILRTLQYICVEHKTSSYLTGRALAPMLVADLSNCLDKTNSFCSRKSKYNWIILSAN
jgi:hypothetical protein